MVSGADSVALLIIGSFAGVANTQVVFFGVTYSWVSYTWYTMTIARNDMIAVRHSLTTTEQ
jgi:hypothetical protein